MASVTNAVRLVREFTARNPVVYLFPHERRLRGGSVVVEHVLDPKLPGRGFATIQDALQNGDAAVAVRIANEPRYFPVHTSGEARFTTSPFGFWTTGRPAHIGQYHGRLVDDRIAGYSSIHGMFINEHNVPLDSFRGRHYDAIKNVQLATLGLGVVGTVGGTGYALTR